MKHILLVLVLLVTAGCGPGTPVNREERRNKLVEDSSRVYAELPDAAQAGEMIERGRRVFRSAGCEACHSMESERKGLAGPPLGGVSERVLARHDNDPLEARRWLVRHIKDPNVEPGPFKQDPDYKGLHMTANPRIPDDDMRALVEFLWSLR